MRPNPKPYSTTVTVIIAICAFAGCETTLGHDLAPPQAAPGSYKWAAQRIALMPVDRAIHQATPPGLPAELEYVIVLPNRWPVGQDIRVCFIGGDNTIRKRILNTVEPWFQYANLRLVAGLPSGKSCDPQDNSEIRIGFSEPGYWSYIGTDSLRPDLVSQNLSSMNFQGFDLAAPAEPRFTGIVLHEFGHALGFHHEHQSPASGCDKEYNWTKLYAFYLNAYGWDQAKVDQNVRPLLADHSAYDWSKADPLSIMIYASDPRFLKKGKKSSCYFHDNNQLSKLDKEGAAKTYSKQDVELSLKARASSLDHALQSRVGGDTRAILSRQLELTTNQLKLEKSRQ